VFEADGSASQIIVGVYNATAGPRAGCTETLLYTGSVWVTAGRRHHVDGRSGHDRGGGLHRRGAEPRADDPGDNPTLEGTYAIAGDTLTLTLNGSTVELTKD